MTSAPALQRRASLPVPVNERPHWRIRIRPAVYDSRRLPTLKSCWAAVEAASVRLRGWDYPHLEPDPASRQQGNHWIASWVDWERHVEYWRFFQSGQFIHLRAIWEDYDFSERWSAIRPHRVPQEFSPTGGVSFLNVLYSVTEAYAFGANLGLRNAFGEAVFIDISLAAVRDHVLLSYDTGRFFPNFYRATVDTIDHSSGLIRVDQLVASHADMAFEATMAIYERFGWVDPPRETLARDQATFLAGRA